MVKKRIPVHKATPQNKGRLNLQYSMYPTYMSSKNTLHTAHRSNKSAKRKQSKEHNIARGIPHTFSLCSAP